MQKQLIKIGSSLGIIIDKPILELLRITPETSLEMTTDGDSLVFRPVRFMNDAQVRESYERIAVRHRVSLKKLAE